MGVNTDISDDMLKIINAAITQAVTQAVQQTKSVLEAAQPAAPNRDYFKITEKLLYNYPKLKRLISDKEKYIRVESKERSKSIVGINYDPSFKSKEDIIKEMERERESMFDKTLSELRRLEEVIELFKDRKEFIVVRMYYFNEDVDGNNRNEDEEKNTFMDIGIDLGIDEKTVRRWRNNIVNDIAVCLFGIEAAISSGTLRNT